MGKILNPIYVTEEGHELALAEYDAYYAEYLDFLKTRGEYGVNKTENYKTGDWDIQNQLYLCQLRSMRSDIERHVFISKENSQDGRIGLDDIVVVYLFDKPDDPIMRIQLTGGKPEIREGLTKVTRQSPMGEAVWGKKVGDKVKMIIKSKTGNQVKDLEILSVERELQKENEQPKQQGEE